MSPNGNGHSVPTDLPPGALLLGNGDRFTISQGQRWRCPACGDEPKNFGPGVPEAVATQLDNDEKQFHCGRCFQKWQAEEQVRKIRAEVPRLVPIEPEG